MWCNSALIDRVSARIGDLLNRLELPLSLSKELVDAALRTQNPAAFMLQKAGEVVAYTFFGLDRLSEQLEFRFGRHANDLPLDAICRIHEISIAEALGEPAPDPLQPVEFQLQ